MNNTEQKTRISASKWWSYFNSYIEIGYSESSAEETVNADFYCPSSELNEE